MPNADGALQLKALGVRLKALGAAGDLSPVSGLGSGRTLRAQLLGGIRAAAKPAVDATRQAARDSLPKKGGLNVYVADEKILTSIRLAGPKVGVRIKPASGGSWGDDQASVRHPVFGRRDRPWRTTQIAQPGWFSETLAREAPKAVVQIRAVMEAVAAEATGRL